MKKLVAIILTAVLLLGLVSCGADEIGDVIDIIEETSQIYGELQEIKEDEHSEPGETAIPDPASEEPEPVEEPEEIISDVPEEPEPAEPVSEPEEPLDEDGRYTTKDDVALYIYTYGHLPANFITKKEAQKYGWSGGGLTGELAGMSIGGDRFGNYEGLLPEGNYTECDIDTMNAKSRGAKRIVFSEDAIYYTGDHYETFERLY